MEILEIQMKHFGRFADQEMSFHSGVNVIYGENETGKSTVHSFLKAMLYGLEKMRGRTSKKDEYLLRRPWEHSSRFEGAMRFQVRGKRYRIYRNFAKQEREVRLYCETDGKELDTDGAALAALLGGMDEAAFRNTVYVGQRASETDENLASTIRNFLINCRSAGTPEVDLKKALEQLNQEKKTLEGEKKKHMAERIGKLQELRMRMDYTRQELKALYDEEETCREKLKQLAEKSRREQEEEGDFPERRYEREKKGIAWKIGEITMAVLASGAMAAALISERWEIRALACGLILLSCLGVMFFGKKDRAYREEKREWERQYEEQRLYEELKRRERILKRQEQEAPVRQKLSANLEWLQNAQQEKENLLESLEEQCRSEEETDDEGKELEEKLSGIYLAIDTMKEVAEEICEELSDRLNRRVSTIISEITDGRYERILLDEKMTVKIHTPDRVLDLEQVSRGTMEQIYFALRMAAAELLSPGETLPILLDDAFGFYDDVRLERTMRWLLGCGRQVILFTCQKREEEILEKIYTGGR